LTDRGSQKEYDYDIFMHINYDLFYHVKHKNSNFMGYYSWL